MNQSTVEPSVSEVLVNASTTLEKVTTRDLAKKRGYMQRSYYITPNQNRIIKLLAAEDGTDTSSIVREAIQDYIQNRSQTERVQQLINF